MLLLLLLEMANETLVTTTAKEIKRSFWRHSTNVLYHSKQYYYPTIQYDSRL